MQSRICDLLGIEYPIFQGGMAWVSYAPLVAAVSNAGGLGILGSGSMLTEDELRGEIRTIRDETDKPFGVNLLANHPLMKEFLQVLIQESVPVVTYGIGNPKEMIETCERHGIKRIPVIPSVKWARRAEQDGADAIIAEGMESGGHVGYLGTMALVPQVVDNVKVPVVAAGGIGDARGFVAALSLGAEGIQMGSRFICTQESLVPMSTKRAILESRVEDTVITGNITGLRCRVLKNKLAEDILRMEESKVSKEEMSLFGMGKMRQAFVQGDAVDGSVMIGQICGMIEDVPTVKELIDGIVSEAETILSTVNGKLC